MVVAAERGGQNDDDDKSGDIRCHREALKYDQRYPVVTIL